MSTVFEIPLIAAPQKLSITLIATVYNLTVSWNTFAQCWMLDIDDASNNSIVTGIPLVTGADLLAQYEYLGIGGPLFVQTDNAIDEIPTYDNLGTDSHLYFVST